MSKKIGTIRTGTALPVEYEGRIRHTIVEGVDNQNTLEVRLGKNSAETKFTAIRVPSTDTRGFLFEGSPGITLLKEAVWWIDSVYSANDGQSVQNLGFGGSVLDAQCGSTTGADSNDPKYLDWQGENYVYLPGVAGNYLSVPDEAALDITGDIDIRALVALDDWTPGSANIIASKRSSGNFSWQLWINATTGIVSMAWSADGTASVTQNSTAAPAVSDGQALWVRATLDVDNAGVYEVKFYTSQDGVSWTQLGATRTGASTTSIFSGSAPIEVGARASGTTDILTGRIYRAQVLNGIDGTTVLDIDCDAITSGSATSFTASTGQTVTINRSASGRKAVAVTHPCWLFGTDDYMEVADNDLLDFGASDSFTVLAVVRRWNTQATNAVVSKGNSVSAGLRGWAMVAADTDRLIFYVGDGTNIDADISSLYTSGPVSLLSYTRTANGTVDTYGVNGVLTTGSSTAVTGSLATTDVVRVGRMPSGSPFYADMEFIAAAIFRRALTAGEITTLNNYFTGRVS